MKRKYTGNTEHKNALLKLLKSKKMVLQIDAEKRLNRKSIKGTVQKLEEEGKIKRQKVKLRQPMGNLVDVWLLYLPGTNQNEILEYEKELINRPFKSPLEEHHCYKKVEPEESKEMIISENLNNSNNTNNVVNMSDYVKVNDYELKIKEHNGQRVVTLKEVDEVHQRPEGTARKRFNENKHRFIEGEDYFVLKTDEAKNIGIKAPNGLVLITETGYMMLVKSFTDDLAWTIQRQLVNSYFKIKELKQDPTLQTVPQVQAIDRMDILSVMFDELKEQRERVSTLENKFNNLIKALSQ